MTERTPSGLRVISASFVAEGPTGVAIKTRLHATAVEDGVLREVGTFLGSLARRDLATRCRDGLAHSKDTWAVRKRALTGESSSRWAGAITKASHDQWALARRCQAAHLANMDAGIATIRHRLSRPVGENGRKGAPGGYKSRQEWHAKTRRLATLQARRAIVAADRDAGRVSVVAGGRRLANNRHNLADAGLTGQQWRDRWDAARMFLSADGEAGKRYGNETIRVTPNGQVTVKLPAHLAHLANDKHGRYTIAAPVRFAHRGDEWASRVETNSAVAYTITFDPARARWYLTAAWQPASVPQVTWGQAVHAGCIGVDTNDDHYAAWRLDRHGNPIGRPRRFYYDMGGTADHRDAQIRHATTRLLHWARQVGAMAIGIENLDFADGKTREKHGRRKAFRRLISRFPTTKLRSRLVSMAAEQGLAIVAVDPAYTSRWGAEHWQKPTTTARHKTTRHEAASLVVGRRALGHPARRRTPPPPSHQSDGVGHRSAQAQQRDRRREGTRPPETGPPTRWMSPPGQRTREPSLPNTVRDRRTKHGLTHAQC
jgi:IS605 OrfB family transposase